MSRREQIFVGVLELTFLRLENGHCLRRNLGGLYFFENLEPINCRKLLFKLQTRKALLLWDLNHFLVAMRRNSLPQFQESSAISSHQRSAIPGLETDFARSAKSKVGLAESSNGHLLRCPISSQLVMEYHKQLFNLIGLRKRRDYRRSFRRRMAVDSKSQLLRDVQLIRIESSTSYGSLVQTARLLECN